MFNAVSSLQSYSLSQTQYYVTCCKSKKKVYEGSVCFTDKLKSMGAVCLHFCNQNQLSKHLAKD